MFLRQLLSVNEIMDPSVANITAIVGYRIAAEDNGDRPIHSRQLHVITVGTVSALGDPMGKLHWLIHKIPHGSRPAIDKLIVS